MSKARTWTIPGSRTKNKKAHIVHLAEPAWKVIEACSGQPYVFGTATESGSSNSEGESALSTNFAESLVGDFMT